MAGENTTPRGCFDDVQTEDLTACVNTETAAGLSEVHLYYAVHQQIKVFPEVASPGDASASMESLVDVVEDIEFYPTKGFSQITVQSDTGEVKTSLVGTKGNLKHKNVLNFYVPGNDKKLLGFMRKFKNMPLLFIATERDGQKRLIGDAYNAAFMKEGEGSTGKGGEEDKGIQFSIESYSLPLVYSGNIQRPALPDVLPPTT